MTDREKVIRGLEACALEQAFVDCKNCPYNGGDTCIGPLMRDALALLKEQGKQLKEWEKHVPFLAAHGILKGDEDNA